ncbi:hypothetical protein COO60DRAFT_1701845 [Scenedesmus sp. NREL 46B-D3]|nr:hypothetical protein COO60DRAFT_1701845 [Scenedesmus sp. NREL 46B-D3]
MQEAAHAPAAVAYVMQCLLYCQQHVGELSAGLKHLLLELVQPEAAQAAGEQARGTAVQLFTIYCTPQDAKLAAKVAGIFQLTRHDLSDWQQLTQAVRQMLTSQSSYKAAVHLLMQFEGLDEAIDKAEVITQLVADGQDNLAQQWVTALGRDHQVMFVEACVAQDRLKPAARAVRVLGLTAEFPNIESLYRQRSLARLVGKRLWPVALSFVGSDVGLQVCGAVEGLVRQRGSYLQTALLFIVTEYRKQLNLPESVLTVDPAALAAQEEARRQQYMQLELPPGALLFVDDEPKLLQATQMLAGSDAVGLDVEWKPAHAVGETSPAAVLQLATRKSAVLFDLLTLAPQHPAALDACLAPLFASPEVLKLGFGLAGDLAKLAGSWPDVQAFRVVAGVLDLRPLWVAYGVATKRQGGSVRLLSNVGLTTLCSALLGKPLDKSQQMSDWTARPLSQRQAHYAALDAFVLPQLYDRLCTELGQQRSQQLLKQHTSSVRRVSVADEEQQQRQGQGGSAREAAESKQQQHGKARKRRAEAASPPQGAPPAAAGVVAAAEEQALAAGLAAADLDEVVAAAAAAAAAARNNFQALQDLHRMVAAAAACLVVMPAAAAAAALVIRVPAPQGQGQRCVPTISDTAAALSAPRAAVAKTMALLVGHEPVLVVTRGDQRVDMHKARNSAAASRALAALLGVKKRAVRIAPDSVVKEVTGFGSGGIPPIGHNSSIKVLVDSRLQQAAAADISAGCDPQQQQQQQPEGPSRPAGGCWAAVAGAATASVIQLSFERLLQLSSGTVADVADVPAAPLAASNNAADGGSSCQAKAAGQQQSPSSPSNSAQTVPRFLVDSMLGRLCRWLRALGVDAEFVETGGKQQLQQAARVQGQPLLVQSLGQQQQGQLIEAIHKAALSEGRLFLTRDTKLAARRDVGGSVYLLNTDDAAEQLTEISRHFGIEFDESTAMSRCSVCNAAAFEQISRAAAAALVPPRVMEVVEEFWRCGSCGKVFWMGPKSQAAIDLLSSLFTNGKTVPTPLQSWRQLEVLTFSGPPYVPKAKAYQRADYSHSTTKLMKIAHDNQLLVKRLTSISHKGPNWVKDLGKTASCNVSSSAVNRRKAAFTIAQENHALYQRLVAIRPSKDISKETLEAEHRRNEGYRVNCANFKPKSSPGAAGPTADARGAEGIMTA